MLRIYCQAGIANGVDSAYNTLIQIQVATFTSAPLVDVRRKPISSDWRPPPPKPYTIAHIFSANRECAEGLFEGIPVSGLLFPVAAG